MKKIIFIVLGLSVIFLWFIACSLSKKTTSGVFKNEIILHPRLTDSIVIYVDDISVSKELLKNIKIEPKINVRYLNDIYKKTITIFPVPQFEELTKYKISIFDEQKTLIYNYLTGPDLCIFLSTKHKPKAWLESSIMKYDGDSIPLVNYSGKYEVNPTTICQFAMSCYDDYIQNNNQISKNYFLRQVKYLADNHIDFAEGIAFPYNFSAQGMIAPWYSALAQGHAASMFVRAYFLTNDIKYLDMAKKSINYMIARYPNGTLNYTAENFVWLEEYPKNPPSSVLNGFVSAIFGLIDYSKLYPNDTAVANCVKYCLISLKTDIHLYDTGNWLIYDRSTKNNVNNNYIGMQTLQMKQLYKATKDTAFLNYYYKWEKYFNWEDWLNNK